MTISREIRRLVSQLFIVGFNGYSVPDDLRSLIEDWNLGGVLYFKRNVQSPGQLVELSNEIQFGCRPSNQIPLFIAIDHEGGRVNRLVKPFTKFPGNQALGELNSPKIGFEFGAVIAKELAAVGINLNFAPVVDVQVTENEGLRTRSFSSDPEIVAKLGSAVSRGIQRQGVMAVAKHFPGHGGVKEDSHFKLPKTERTLEELESFELIPFSRVIRSRIEGVMSAHIVNKTIDPDFPATFSKKTIQGILRERLRFKGVVFSDDMEMKAVTETFDPATAAVNGFKAGLDCLIYKGESPDNYTAAMEAVCKAVVDKDIPQSQLETSADRIAKAKHRYAKADKAIEVTEVGSKIGLPEHFKLADVIVKKEIPTEA